MRIIIDARATLERERCGVATYAAETIRRLAARGNFGYTLWASGSSTRFAVGAEDGWPEDTPTATDDDSIRRVFTARSNRLINSCFAFAGRPRLEDYAGPADLAYLPNLNFLATRLPYVVTVHDLSFIRFPEFFSPKRRAWHHFIRAERLIRCAARIIAVSEHTKTDIQEICGVPANRISVAPPAVHSRYRPQMPEEIARVRAAHNLPERYFLYVGAVEPRKNIEGLISAFEQMPQEYSLVIAGGRGWSNEGIYARARRSTARNRIRFLGYAPEEDKAAIYAGAAAFVFPSFYEGFGMPPVEAMACGTPVVVSHASSLAEAVGDAGLLVNPHDPGTIADAMRAAAEDEKARAILRERGFRQAAKFTWENTAERIEEAFKKTTR
jgi:glycosyltransferase involved in cell wall biosynthesis